MHINLFGVFNAKSLLLEEQHGTIWTYTWEDTWVLIFSKGICPKVNVITQLEFEFAKQLHPAIPPPPKKFDLRIIICLRIVECFQVLLFYKKFNQTCWERKNFVFWFGAQFNSTLNFTQSGWLILFSPDLHFRPTTLGKLPNTLSLAVERRPVQTSHCGSRIAAAATCPHEGTHSIYGFLTRNPSWI